MKKLTYSAIVLSLSMGVITLTSCGSSESPKATDESTETNETTEETTEVVVEAVSGDKLFNDNGCVACHQLETKTVGPALKDIAKAYDGNKDGLIAFLKEEGEAIVDPAQAAVMQPQLAVTKALAQNDLNSMVDYILSTK